MFLLALACTATLGRSEEVVATDPDVDWEADDDEFVYEVGAVNYLTGEGVGIGGFLFPELFVAGTTGVFESGTDPERFASSEHDPLNRTGIQGIDLHMGVNIADTLTGMVAAFGHQGEGEVWDAEIEEAYLHYHVAKNVAVGGGQFLNTFGFQADKHLPGWDFVNQNLANSRMLNEGELVTQGGELILELPETGSVWTVAAGGVRTHAHGGHFHEEEIGHGHEDEHHEEAELGHGDHEGEEHGHEEDHDHEHEEDHEDEEHGHHEGHDDHEHHEIDADDANFRGWVFSLDHKIRMPFDESATLSTSFATGANGFDRHTRAYGVGFEKIWGAHDHGFGPEFCAGAFMLRSEYIYRSISGHDEHLDPARFRDHGVSTGIHYGLSEDATLSLRHDWVSEVKALGLEDRHRISPALTVFLDDAQRIRARVQYDCDIHDGNEVGHAAWFQLQFQWGGEGGGHHHHH